MIDYLIGLAFGIFIGAFTIYVYLDNKYDFDWAKFMGWER